MNFILKNQIRRVLIEKKSTFCMKITFVDRSLVSEGDGVLPLTQLETMVKNEEFNTENFSCDPASLVVKPYVTCQAGQILLNGLCGIIYFYIYAN
jgi:hypothetical protein